jgi:hypothetical protein
MRTYTREQIEKAVKSKGYVWFNDDKNIGYDLNIVSVRTSETGKKVTNVFDDVLTLSYKVNGVWQFKQWLVTVDPGTKGVREFKNPNGVARLVPGQYRKSHQLGLHQGKYLALKQQNPVKVYRDANKDAIYDENKIQEGIFGINIHKAGANSTWVENWSEGCTVFKRSADFEEFLAICQKAEPIFGNNFTYTLIESKDIV